LHKPDANAPSRLLRELQGVLYAGSAVGTPEAAHPATDVERAAARRLVERLIDARLVEGGQAAFHLAMAPLALLWEAWQGSQASRDGGQAQCSSGSGVDVGGGSDDSNSNGNWFGRSQLRALVEIAELLLINYSDAAPCDAPHRWAAALGLCAAAELLQGPRSSCGTSISRTTGADARVVPDFPGLAQAERTLTALVSTACNSLTAAGMGHGAAFAPARELAVLPWERRLALLPLIEAGAAGAWETGIERQRWESLVEPPVAAYQSSTCSGIDSGSTNSSVAEAVGVVRLSLAFAASSDEHAQLLSGCFGQSDPPCSDSSGSSLAPGTAAELALAVARLPGTALRPALMLAVAELLPFATEAVARRVLAVALPAMLAARTAPATLQGRLGQQLPEETETDRAALVVSAIVQLTCRAVFVFHVHSQWARSAAAVAHRQVAQQLFRHVSTLILHLLRHPTAEAGEEAGGAEKQERHRQRQSARLRVVQLCLAECCDLLASLQVGVDGSTALQPLLLQLIADIAQPGVVELDRREPAAPAKGWPGTGTRGATAGPASTDAWVGQGLGTPGALSLEDAVVACTGEPFGELLAWAAAELGRLPCTQQLLPALAHMGAAAAASMARGPGEEIAASSLREQAEAAVEAAAARAAVPFPRSDAFSPTLPL
jgi:hypothetical protein